MCSGGGYKMQGVSFLVDEVGRVIRAALDATLAEIEQDKTDGH